MTLDEIGPWRGGQERERVGWHWAVDSEGYAITHAETTRYTIRSFLMKGDGAGQKSTLPLKACPLSVGINTQILDLFRLGRSPLCDEGWAVASVCHHRGNSLAKLLAILAAAEAEVWVSMNCF